MNIKAIKRGLPAPIKIYLGQAKWGAKYYLLMEELVQEL